MPHPTRHSLEIIRLPDRTQAPAGATWVNVAPAIGGTWSLEGNIPVPAGVMFEYGEFPSAFEAAQAAIDFARSRGCEVLYVETDARRCRGW